MKKKIIAIVAAIIVIFVVIASTLIANHESLAPATISFKTLGDIQSLSEQIDFSSYDPESIIAADEQSGLLAEKIKGDPSAPVVIYEYADYSCSHCADINTEVNRIYKDYNGKVAIVFRSYLLGFPNSVSMASAATAAELQGYWEQFKNTIFSEQSAWYRLTGSKLEDYLVTTFTEISGGKGDVEKFKSDIASDAVAQKLAFDQAAGNAVGLTGTPHFRINGEQVSANELRTKIDEILNQ